jgi:translation initiation factor IF-1
VEEDDRVEISGIVREQLPRALYRVEVEGRQLIVAHLTGSPRRNFVRLLEGDRVLVELSPVDRGRGRIVRRLGRGQ